MSGAVTQLLDLVMLFYACHEAEAIYSTDQQMRSADLFPDVLLGEGSVQAGERRADHHLRELCRAGARPHGRLHVPPAAQHISDTAGMKTT